MTTKETKTNSQTYAENLIMVYESIFIFIILLTFNRVGERQFYLSQKNGIVSSVYCIHLKHFDVKKYKHLLQHFKEMPQMVYLK